MSKKQESMDKYVVGTLFNYFEVLEFYVKVAYLEVEIIQLKLIDFGQLFWFFPFLFSSYDFLYIP